MSKVPYSGSCHCGAVKFAVRTEETRVLRCNCSVCTKKGLLHLIVPMDEFELLSGQDALTTYTFGTHTAKHTFCKECGVQAFYTPRSHPDCVDINPRCLDGADLGWFDIVPFDGTHWEANVATIQAPEDAHPVTCPFCNEVVELYVDPGTEGEYVEDCAVCCRPWIVTVNRSGGSVQVSVAPGN